MTRRDPLRKVAADTAALLLIAALAAVEQARLAVRRWRHRHPIRRK